MGLGVLDLGRSMRSRLRWLLIRGLEALIGLFVVRLLLGSGRRVPGGLCSCIGVARFLFLSSMDSLVVVCRGIVDAACV